MKENSFLSRLGRGLFYLLCTAGVLAGGFLLLRAGGWAEQQTLPGEEAAPAAGTVVLREEPLPRRAAYLPLEELDQAAAHGAVAVPMKEEDGTLGYVSALTLAMDTGASSGEPGRNRALAEMNRIPGLHTVALVSCLRDGRAARGELALTRESGSPWRDAGGMTWLDPASPGVRDYLEGVCRELAALGFDEILLTHCAYPPGGGPREGRAEGLEDFCRDLQTRLGDCGVLLSAVGEGDAAAGGAESGQTLSLLASFHRVWAGAGEREALAAFEPVPLPGT